MPQVRHTPKAHLLADTDNFENPIFDQLFARMGQLLPNGNWVEAQSRKAIDPSAEQISSGAAPISSYDDALTDAALGDWFGSQIHPSVIGGSGSVSHGATSSQADLFSPQQSSKETTETYVAETYVGAKPHVSEHALAQQAVLIHQTSAPESVDARPTVASTVSIGPVSEDAYSAPERYKDASAHSEDPGKLSLDDWIASLPPVSNATFGSLLAGRPFKQAISVESFVKAGMSDSQAVQAAVDFAARNGGATVYFAPRDYVFTETVHLASGVTVEGNGATVRWPATGSAFSFFRADAVSSVDIHGFKFVWSGRTETTPVVQTHAIVVQNSRDIIIGENNFVDAKAIHIVGSEDVFIVSNDILRGAEGIVVGGLTTAEVNVVPLSQRIVISANYIQGQRREAIDINSNASDVQIVGNTLVGGDPGRANNFQLDELLDIGGGIVRNVVVKDNIFHGADTYIAAIRAKLGAQNLTISGNVFAGLLVDSNGAALVAADVSNLVMYENWTFVIGNAVLLMGGTSGRIDYNDFGSLIGAHVHAIGAANFVSQDGNRLTRTFSTYAVPGIGQLPGYTEFRPGRPWAETLTGSNSGEIIDGGAGADVIRGQHGNDSLRGGTGRDSLSGDSGADQLFGGPDADTLVGGEGDDWLQDDGDGDNVLDGGEGNDTLLDGSGRDRLSGGIGQDHLEGSYGRDTLRGDAGADTLSSGADNDLLDGGDDNDLLSGMDGSDSITAGRGADTTHGGAGHDSLVGGEGPDVLFGGSENDLIHGDDGADSMAGELGADTLNGGFAGDTLAGGSGQDLFIYAQLSAPTESDWVVDFVAGQDRISLLAIDANPRIAGDQAFLFIGTSAFSSTSAAVRHWRDGQNTHVEARIDGDAEGVILLTLAGHHTLSGADFLL